MCVEGCAWCHHASPSDCRVCSPGYRFFGKTADRQYKKCVLNAPASKEATFIDENVTIAGLPSTLADISNAQLAKLAEVVAAAAEVPVANVTTLALERPIVAGAVDGEMRKVVTCNATLANATVNATRPPECVTTYVDTTYELGVFTVSHRLSTTTASWGKVSGALEVAYSTGSLLHAARAALAADLGTETFTMRALGGVAVSGGGGASSASLPSATAIPPRVSNQLVPEDQDPCKVANGGCDAMVSCMALPWEATGRLCGGCPAGFTGNGSVVGGCVDVDECLENNGGCFHLSTCVNSQGGRACGPCPAGYVGDGVTCADVDECLENNGGCDPLTACVNTVGGVACGACPLGYKGEGTTGCKLATDCGVNNGGCDALTQCVNLGVGKSGCGACPIGYSGDGTTGCVDTDGCAGNPCAPGVHCTDVPAPGTGHTCGPCPPGQTGNGTVCVANPCFVKNGGCDPLTTCQVDPLSDGGRACSSCPAGYAGTGLAGCVDIDACAASPSPCFPGVACTDLPPPSSGASCGPCPPGYVGDGTTCTDVNECADGNNGGCDLRSTCTNTPGGRTCGPCPEGMLGSGERGCRAPSACATNNGGCDALTTCADAAGGGVTCGACPAGYSGTGAAGCVDIDGCADAPCHPGVVCTDVPAPGLPAPGYTCGACPEGTRGNGTHCSPCQISVRVLGSTVMDGQVKRSSDVRVVAGLSGMASECTNDKGYAFRWSAAASGGEKVTLDPGSTKSDTLQLFVAKRTVLASGLSYTLRLDAWSAGNPKVRASLVFDFYVAAAPLEPVVTGGNARLALGQPFSLDASGSRDPDDDKTYPMTYEWACAKTVGTTKSACDTDHEGNPFSFPKSGTPKIGPFRLAGGAPGAGAAYRWTLTTRVGPRVATAETTVTVVTPPPGAQSKSPPPTVRVEPLPGGGAVNAGEVARLVGTVSAGTAVTSAAAYKLTWRAERVKEGAASSPEAVDLTTPGLLLTTAGVKGENLVLAPNALVAGFRYTFTLRAEDPTDASVAGEAFTYVSANVAPSGGGLAVVPGDLKQAAMQTTYSMVAAGWSDAHPPLSYRFTARPVGASTAPEQLRDFGPVAEYKGVLPGGSAAFADLVTVSVTVRDALGAVSAPASVNVTAKWPSLASPAAATAATAALVGDATRLVDVDPEKAIAVVSGACAQLAHFEAGAARRRTFLRRMLAAGSSSLAAFPKEDDCGAAVGTTGAEASRRSAQRRSMLGVVTSASVRVPASETALAAAAAGAASALGAPCETDAAARRAGIDLVASLVDLANASTATAALSEAAAASVLAALSSAAARGGLANTSIGSIGGGVSLDVNATAREANVRERNATILARRSMALALAKAVAGETPVVVTSSRIVFAAERLVPENVTVGSLEGAAVAGSGFAVPAAELFRAVVRAGAVGASLDRAQATFYFDAHAADQDNARETAAIEDARADRAGTPRPERSVYRHAARASPTVSLSFGVAASQGGHPTPLAVVNLSTPITFGLPLSTPTRRPTCPTVDAANATAVAAETARLKSLDPNRPGEIQPACTFWDEAKNEYSDAGCGTLPSVYPPGGATFGWDAAVLDGTFNFSGSSRGRPGDVPGAMRWARTFKHPTALVGCTLNETLALDNATRLVTWTGASCVLEDPANDLKCFWRRESQQFEGCGCVAATALACACTHLTDFVASAAPPKINVITLNELTVVSLADVEKSSTMLVCVFLFFVAAGFLGIVFALRDRRALRKIRRRFFSGDRAARSLGFAEVKGVWTWSCEMHDVQSMFMALYATDKDLDGSGLEVSDLKEDTVFDSPAAAARLQRAWEERFWGDNYLIMRGILTEKGFAGLQINMSSAVFVSFMKQIVRDDLKTQAPEILAALNRGEDPEKAAEKAWSHADEGVRNRATVMRVLRGDLTPANAPKPPELQEAPKLAPAANKARTMRRSHYVEKWTDEDEHAAPGDEAEFRAQVKRRAATLREREREAIALRMTAVEEAGVTCMRADDGRRLDGVEDPDSGRTLCKMVGLNYVRFNVSFPVEQLRRSLVVTRLLDDDEDDDDDAAKVDSEGDAPLDIADVDVVGESKSERGEKHGEDEDVDDEDEGGTEGMYLPFNRALGTAMVYAYFDVKNVVSHSEMTRRIYEASRLPWLLPEGYTFVYLVSTLKHMLLGSLTSPMWMQRSALWNLVSLQAPDGSWGPDDALAGAMRAAGDFVAVPSSANAFCERPIIKSYFTAETMLGCMPRSLQACAARHGWALVDKVWCTLLAVSTYEDIGHRWVVNPWDEDYVEFDIGLKAWSFLDVAANDDPALAAAILEARADAAVNVERWRTEFTECTERFKHERDSVLARRAADNSLSMRTKRFMDAIPSYSVNEAILGIGQSAKQATARSVKGTKWAVGRYMRAHMFWRCFTATPTDAFTATERIVMQATMYFLALVVTVWFFYERAEACCLQLRQDLGCSSNVLETCKGVGGGCSQLMSQTSLHPADWQCAAFPDTAHNAWHLVWVIVINVLIMFPVKFILVRLFTVSGHVFVEPHWQAALIHAGLSYIEVYVAWMEVAYQILTDPAGALGSPEFGKILATCRTAFTKCGMMCCISCGTFLFVTVPDKVSRLFRRPSETKSVLYPDQGSVVRRLEAVGAVDAPEAVPAAYRTPLFTALERSRAEGEALTELPAAIAETTRAEEEAMAETGNGISNGGSDAKAVAAFAAIAAGKAEPASGLAELEREVRRQSARTTTVDGTLVSRVNSAALGAWQRRCQQLVFLRSILVNHAGWFIAGAVWIIGAWVAVAYGGLVYTYLGEGEEREFIRVWAITFLINNFGLESMAIIARKAVFIWIIEKMNVLMRYRTVVEWYGTFVEHGLPGVDTDEDANDRDEDDEGDGYGNVADDNAAVF